MVRKADWILRCSPHRRTGGGHMPTWHFQPFWLGTDTYEILSRQPPNLMDNSQLFVKTGKIHVHTQPSVHVFHARNTRSGAHSPGLSIYILHQHAESWESRAKYRASVNVTEPHCAVPAWRNHHVMCTTTWDSASG